MPKTTSIRKEKSLQEFKKMLDSINRYPKKSDWKGKYNLETPSFYKWHFGSIDNVVKRLRPELLETKNRRKLPDELIIDTFYKIKKSIGRCPTFKEYRNLSKIAQSVIELRFGGWINFLKSLNETPYKVISNTAKMYKPNRYLSKAGNLCYSKRELLIDNILYELGINFDKEVYYPKDEQYNINRRKRCDWKIGDTYVEYFGGLNFTNKHILQKYEKSVDDKIDLCLKHNLNLLMITPEGETSESIKNIIIEEFGGKQNGK
jgi:hypothetical protein